MIQTTLIKKLKLNLTRRIKTMKTLSTIKSAVQKYIDMDRENNDLYNKLVEALKKHDGQKITKRLATSVEKHLGSEYQVYFKQEGSMYYINIRKNGQSSRDWKQFLIGYTSAPTFRLVSGDKNAVDNGLYSERGFDDYSRYAGNAALERIKANEKFLKSGKAEKLAELIDQKNEIENKISKLTGSSIDFPAVYSVERALRGEA